NRRSRDDGLAMSFEGREVPDRDVFVEPANGFPDPPDTRQRGQFLIPSGAAAVEYRSGLVHQHPPVRVGLGEPRRLDLCGDELGAALVPALAEYAGVEETQAVVVRRLADQSDEAEWIFHRVL